ncbi:MAG: DUF4062 domain-containing protein [Victivallales bacterium]|nr:DUF4062 domain-containing protein [Victivallales bacterium]
MAEKRYQIFVSSTFSDLQEERLKIFSAIMKLNHIPAGMEFFTAVDEEQMHFIQRIIDESDYYVLVLGARYGSLDNEGISYTEREYDYAVEKGLKVIALLHADPDNIERGKTDKDEGLFKKFMAFRDKVSGNKRLVSFWRDTGELVTQFQASLIQTISLFPRTGWMRGDSLATTDMLRKVAELELENQRLREHIKGLGSTPIANDITMEAASVTNPDYFSDSEIECVSVNLKISQGNIPAEFLQFKSPYNLDDMVKFWQEALKWFQYMLQVCRFDLKISNPNQFIIENMDGDYSFYAEDGSKLSFIDMQTFRNPPANPMTDNYAHWSVPIRSNRNLNPQQSAIFTHHRFFIPPKDMTCSYQRIIYAKNILEPIHKTITIKYKIMPLELTSSETIEIIANLEKQKKFNDAGVFEYVANLLKEKDNANPEEEIGDVHIRRCQVGV